MRKHLFLAVILAVLCLPAMASAGFILEGKYLRVGVNSDGGLIDDGFGQGITYDPTGTSTWLPGDFLKPGTPFEFYALGVNGESDKAGYYHGNTFGATTINTSVGSTLSALTTFSYKGLLGTQTISFDKLSSTIHFDVKLTNMSGSTKSVVYARGLDPDQDVYMGGGYPTLNVESPDLVTATGPLTNWKIGILTDGKYTHAPGISAPWETDPYKLLLGPNDGDGDYTINMAWNLGELRSCDTAAFSYDYVIGGAPLTVTPEPGTLVLLGLGLVGVAFVRRRMKASDK